MSIVDSGRVSNQWMAIQKKRDEALKPRAELLKWHKYRETCQRKGEPLYCGLLGHVYAAAK